MKAKHLYIIIVVMALLLFTAPMEADAYVIPEEYRTDNHMVDVEIYLVSVQHQDTWWGAYNLNGLAWAYTNSGRSQRDLAIKMQFYIGLRGNT